MKIGVNVTDIQGDFTEWKDGSLSVPGTDEAYVREVEAHTRRLREAGAVIFATQDWHPANHVSFHTSHPGKEAFDAVTLHEKRQILWPPHCVQNTPGAKILLAPALLDAVVRKGMNPLYDSYSGFKDDGGNKTVMEGLLRRESIGTFVVYGLATDYCVKATALDAAAAGLRVAVVLSLSRGITPESTRSAIDEMRAAGVAVLDEPKLELIRKL
jgi:nicotinamidase/pyrazinamidase